MGMKGSGEADLTEIDRFEGGVGWLAYPDETMERASHAVESDGQLWIFDPVDADGVDDLVELPDEVVDPVGVDRVEHPQLAVALDGV